MKELEAIKESIASLKPRLEADEVPAHHIIDGENVMLWLPSHANKFALDLMGKMFTREEMAGHLCSKDPKRNSPRPLLPREKVPSHTTGSLFASLLQVEHIIKLVLEKFPPSKFNVDMKSLRLSMNQKCRYCYRLIF